MIVGLVPKQFRFVKVIHMTKLIKLKSLILLIIDYFKLPFVLDEKQNLFKINGRKCYLILNFIYFFIFYVINVNLI